MCDNYYSEIKDFDLRATRRTTGAWRRSAFFIQFFRLIVLPQFYIYGNEYNYGNWCQRQGRDTSDGV